MRRMTTSPLITIHQSTAAFRLVIGIGAVITVLVRHHVGAFPQPPSFITAIGQQHLSILSVTNNESKWKRRPRALSLSGDDSVVLGDGLNGDNKKETSDDEDDIPLTPIDAFYDDDVFEFELVQHSPLGCTVEESLVADDDGLNQVFVAKVTEGGNAQKVGIQIGDVIIGVSGVFGELEDVAGLGLERVQRLVKGRPKEEPLLIRVKRGTDIPARHDKALEELCKLTSSGDDPISPLSEKELNNCINSFLAGDDNDLVFHDDGLEASSHVECNTDDEDCMLNAAFDLWVDEIPEEVGLTGGSPVPEETGASTQGKNKIAPWSSRSSPSGTYVRDPLTGEMRNIDEDY